LGFNSAFARREHNPLKLFLIKKEKKKVKYVFDSYEHVNFRFS